MLTMDDSKAIANAFFSSSSFGERWKKVKESTLKQARGVEEGEGEYPEMGSLSCNGDELYKLTN